MQLGLLPDEEPFRASASEWLPRELEGPVADIRGLRTLTAMAERRRDWEKRLGEAGWFCIAWPREYGGRDASLVQQVLFAEEYARLGPPPRLNHIRVELAGPTILAFGTEDQKSRFLPAIASGDKIWCQGYSEPNTGSDLAGTEATLDPGECGVDGQKVCTSLVEHSEWIFIVAGSEAGTAGLNGLSFPLLRVEQPRAAVPPTRQMKGECELKETFFDTADHPGERPSRARQRLASRHVPSPRRRRRFDAAPASGVKEGA